MSSNADLLAEAIRILAIGLGVDPVPASGTPEQEFRKAKRNDVTAQAMRRAELRAATLGRELCAVPDCTRLERDGGWCHAHWPDDVAIERAMRGEPATLMHHERVEAIRRLHASGRSTSEIQTRLRVSGETIANAITNTQGEAA